MSEQTLLIRISNPYPVLHEALISLNPGQTVQIGRGEENDVVVINNYVSRNHLLLFWNGSKPFVRDLKSLNGTKLNGRQLKGDSPIQPGDNLELSNVKIALLPGLGTTKEIPADTVEQLKIETLAKRRRESPFPEKAIESTMTLVSDAPAHGKSFVQSESRRDTLWQGKEAQAAVEQLRKGHNNFFVYSAVALVLVALAILLW